MPRFQQPPARLNLRAVVLLLTASALSFALAFWAFPGRPAPGPEGPRTPSTFQETAPVRLAPDAPSPEQTRPSQLRLPGEGRAIPSANTSANTAANISPNATMVAARLAARPDLANATAQVPAAANRTTPAQASANRSNATRAEPAPTPAKTPVKPPAQPPAQSVPAAKTPAKPVVQPSPGRVLGLTLTPGRDEFVLLIRTDRKIERYTSINLDNPKKLAIDLHGQWSQSLKPSQEVDKSFVRAVVVGQHPDFLRLVLVFDEKAKSSPIRASFSNGPEGLTVRVPR